MYLDKALRLNSISITNILYTLTTIHFPIRVLLVSKDAFPKYEKNGLILGRVFLETYVKALEPTDDYSRVDKIYFINEDKQLYATTFEEKKLWKCYII